MSSSISWTDETWNPVVGCSHCSPGCDHCYAETMAVRLAAMGRRELQAAEFAAAGAKMPGTVDYVSVVDLARGRWNGAVTLRRQELSKPFGWKKPRLIFGPSMGDLFHESVPFEWIDEVFDVAARCPRHVFQVLTKRPERMAAYLADLATKEGHERAVFGVDGKLHRIALHGAIMRLRANGDPLPNVWLGATVCDQREAELRIPHLLRCPAAVRFVSIEPMLGPVDLTRVRFATTGAVENVLSAEVSEWAKRAGIEGLARLDWVICGGESGPKAREPSGLWIRRLRDQCVAFDVPFHFKQWGDDYPSATAFEAGANPEAKHGGCMLDGREWKQFPRVWSVNPAAGSSGAKTGR